MTISHDPGVVEGLIDSKGLASRLGVSQATIRSWRSRGAAWLPEPAGRLDGLVWREQDLAGIETLIPHGPGRPSTMSREPRSDRLIHTTDRRTRGAYYTPGDAAHLMAKWLVRHEGETYLEPSLGDGVFVEAVGDVTSAAGMKRPNWIAAELDAETALTATRRGLVTPDEIRIGDFLSLTPTLADGVIANPPYVRLRHLDARSRERALAVAHEHLGAPMAPSGSIWMPFLLRMVASVKLGGRMAVVLPLDFTYVAYALPLWEHLARSFASLRVLRSRERIFGDINQDVLILLADNRGGATDHVIYDAYESVGAMVEGVGSVGGRVSVASIAAGERAFQRALLPEGLDSLLSGASQKGWTIPASDLVTFRIGYVAGDKVYFHPDAETIRKYKLPETSLRRSLINARKLRGHGLRTSGVGEEVVDHLWLPDGELTEGERRYVRKGERAGVSDGYKARIRSPWYTVPGVKSPDAIVTVFSERPLLLINDASWVASNSLLCAYLRSGTVQQLAASWYNPLTLLSIGLEVHSLGGGVVVMVPNEASRVTVLHPDRVTGDIDQIDAALRSGDIAAAYECGAVSLRKSFGSEGADLIAEGIQTLTKWRTR
ncbi:N-6 DNA methylase [Cryobacterium sp. BB307]|uniref:N-6 DNA methylase n=1 Tax=Cryobacterium sp. BB307 TaxID=2716317 RepID=UPI001446A530|nr:N-6 DNA methylase [Cryobacterium sp. BB307]